MLERKEWEKFIKRFPSSKAREAADAEVDKLAIDVTLERAVEVWNDTYMQVAGRIMLKPRS